jgi:hypothetical protein
MITLVASFEVSRSHTHTRARARTRTDARTHTHTHTWQESSKRILGPLQTPLPTQHTTNTKLSIHDFSGFRTRDRSNQATANLGHRPHGHENGHILINGCMFTQEHRFPDNLLLYCQDASPITCYYYPAEWHYAGASLAILRLRSISALCCRLLRQQIQSRCVVTVSRFKLETIC